MQKSYAQYLLLSLLKTFAISIFLTFILIKAVGLTHAGTFEQKQADFIETSALVFWQLILTLSAATAFFTVYKNIRNNRLFNFLAFYLVPIALSGMVRFSGTGSSDWTAFYVGTFCFLGTLGYFYMKSSKYDS